MRVLNTAQMREADRRTIDDIGIPSLVLMENAGRQVVAAMEAAYEGRLNGRVAVLCGRGNNGGDGFVVARTLAQRGVDVSVFLLGRVAEVRGDARTNLEILGRLGITVVEVADSPDGRSMATTGMPDALTSVTTDSMKPLTGALRPVPKIASTISVHSEISEKCSSHA